MGEENTSPMQHMHGRAARKDGSGSGQTPNSSDAIPSSTDTRALAATCSSSCLHTPHFEHQPSQVICGPYPLYFALCTRAAAAPLRSQTDENPKTKRREKRPAGTLNRHATDTALGWAPMRPANADRTSNQQKLCCDWCRNHTNCSLQCLTSLHKHAVPPSQNTSSKPATHSCEINKHSKLAAAHQAFLCEHVESATEHCISLCFQGRARMQH